MLPIRRPSSPWTVSPLLLTLLCLLVLPSAARAGGTFVPRLALHLLPVTSKNACGRAGATPACNDVVTQGALYPATYYAYLLVTNGDASAGVAALQCGLDYNGAPHQGVDIFAWVNCADLTFPALNWPAAGSANLIVWDSTVRCQRQEPGGPGTGVVAASGYFYLAAYSPDVLAITTRPVDKLAAVADCSAQVLNLEGRGVHHDPALLGSAEFSVDGVRVGHNPCTDPVDPIPCLISGPEQVDEATASTYSATNTPPGVHFEWSVSGAATIVGATSNAGVEVLAGSPGSYHLTVVITGGGVLSSCETEVTVLAAAPSCAISGPASVTEGQEAVNYYVDIPGHYDSILWEISGNGTLVTPPFLQLAEIAVGEPGAYELTVSVARTGQPTAVCRKSVTVNPFLCDIVGRDPAPTHTTRVTYGSAGPLAGATYGWQLTGDATLVGPTDQYYVTVSTNEPGSFDLALTMSRGGRTEHCSRTITVNDGSPPKPGSTAKLLINLQPVSARDACGTGSRPRCTAAVTAGALFPARYYAYLLAGDAEATAGLSGEQCGIDYDGAAHSGVDIFSWTLCAGTEIRRDGPGGPWPAPGSGNIIVWGFGTDCRREEPGGPGTGVVATAGYFYLAAYSPDQLKVTVLPVDGRALISDCNSRIYLIGGGGIPPNLPSHLGFANFTADGLSPGFNPCGGNVPVRVTTWSAIKGLYAVPGKPGKP